KKLGADGLLSVDLKHVVTLNQGSDEIRATLVSLSRGFGFARPEEKGSEDIFIHGSALNSAMVGDTILVGNIEKDVKGLSGSVLKIIDNSSATTTGTVKITAFGPEVIPDNNIRYNPRISDLKGAKEGDKVSIRLLQDFRGDWTEAEILTIFGSGESAKICSDAIIARYGIPTVFPPEVLREAESIGALTPTPEEIRNRLDLREEIIFTIDGADAKDLDDAVSVKKQESGFELGVHIADVSHYVTGKSAVDVEAMSRGTSVYFADRVIPMLPEAISNGVCSLNAGTDKLCFSALISLSPQGKILRYRFVKTVINSKVRGVYSEVNEIFAGTASQALLEKYAPVRESLACARELANILEQNSAARGTMEIDSGESQFVLDENGVCIDVIPRQSGEAQELIEQLMITANTAAAKFSMDGKIPYLYRVHESPDPTRVQELADLLKALGIPCKELMSEKPKTGDFSAILNRVRGTGAEVLVSGRLLRTMEKAKYATEPLGHFGLALKDYSHFTSPIRRYPDTSIHRILSAFVGGMSGEACEKRFRAFVEKSAVDSSANEIRAVQAERDAEDCYMAEYMKQHLGEKFTGVVSGTTKNGVFVRLPNSVEGFVPIDSFPENHFVFDGLVTHRCARTGRVLTVGTELHILVASAQVATGRVDFAPDE
ncbi:MAG: ribonuclease R, partial [Oscillospiraceae bacterium]